MFPPPGFEEAATQTSPAALALATILSTLASAIPQPTPTPYSDNYNAESRPHRPPNGECKLLGPFALFVQLALGALALLALVFKRWRERPQRPVKVWAFDVSKQVVGSVLLHAANLLMSMLSSGQFDVNIDVVAQVVEGEGVKEENPCSFYFLNLLIDTTLGIPILIFFLHLFTRLFLLTPLGHPPQSIESGKYGYPPKATWWAKQSLIYFLGLLSMKLVVLLIFLLLPWISVVGDWALRWTEGNEKLQVGFVMLLFPVIMNATQYYIIDTFIKGKLEGAEGGRLDSDDESSGSDLEDGEEEGLLSTGEQEVVVVKHKGMKTRQVDGTGYDEERDGEDVGSGGSSRPTTAKLMDENESGEEEEECRRM